MAEAEVTWEVAKHLVAVLRADAALAGVVIEPGWPGDDQGPEMIWIDSIDSEDEIPVMTGGRQHYDDRFEVPFMLKVVERGTLDATQQRLSEMFAAAQSALQNDPGLGDATDEAVRDAVLSAELVSKNRYCTRTRDGIVGWGRFAVAVHTRIT